MRVTSSMYYNNLFGNSNNKLSKELFDVNRQIASGLKIQYAKDDVGVFVETMRLDNEVTALAQVKKSVESGYKFSDQSDVTLNEFTDSVQRMRTLFVQATNGTNDEISLNAITAELRGIEKNLIGLANTSINGQYLFSGSAVDTKPISDDGTYNGNDISMNAFLGSNNQQQYNITGAELFLGEEVLNKRQITTNVTNNNLLANYPLLQASSEDAASALTPSSTIRQLMGDTDNVVDSVDKHYFYIRGTASDGTSFKNKIAMNDTQSVQELLSNIGNLYGNTANLKVVNVSMNDSGQIVVEDKQKGSSKLDFHMVGAVDFSGGAAANVSDIDDLDVGQSNFAELINPTLPLPTNPNLFVKEFVKSGFKSATGAATNIEGLVYDRTTFSQNGSKLSSNIAQVVKEDNSFATNSTKLSEVFSGTLDTKVLKLEGLQVDGITPYDVDINLLDAGSTFSYGGNTYDIFDVGGNSVAANDVSYKQLMDIVNMAVTGELPATGVNTPTEFHNQTKAATLLGDTFLSYDGKIQFGEKDAAYTQATLSIYDSSSDIFSVGVGSSVGSSATFNANNALTITDPKTDFFKSIDQVITAVEEYKNSPDASSGSPRNVGMQNSLEIIDDLMGHVTRAHTSVGAQSNTLSTALERTQILEISTMSLRSSTVDTDLAEASLRLTQLTLNYEAMLSTVGRVSKLSLVNYL